MLKTFWGTVKLLAASRKFQVAVLSAVIWGLGKIGLNLSEADVLPIVAPLWLYIFGVAVEDAGKARAIVQAESLASLKQPAVIPAESSGE